MAKSRVELLVDGKLLSDLDATLLACGICPEALLQVLYSIRVVSCAQAPKGGAEDLRVVKVPKSARTLRDCAFEGAKQLVSVTVQEPCSEIGYHSFADCSALRVVNLPEPRGTSLDVNLNGPSIEVGGRYRLLRILRL